MSRRHRIHKRRSPVSKWAGRLLALAGTAAVLAVGVLAGTMILKGDDDPAAAQAPVATPAAKPDAPAKKKQPKLTAQQREERRQAADEVRRAGYSPVDLRDYRHDHLLRVLIGEPVGTTPPGLRAFFFVDGEYIGQDATAPSAKLRAGRQREREITLVYTLYKTGNRACCPKGGDTRVHFRWTGDALEPQEPIPPDGERLLPT